MHVHKKSRPANRAGLAHLMPIGQSDSERRRQPKKAPNPTSALPRIARLAGSGTTGGKTTGLQPVAPIVQTPEIRGCLNSINEPPFTTTCTSVMTSPPAVVSVRKFCPLPRGYVNIWPKLSNAVTVAAPLPFSGFIIKSVNPSTGFATRTPAVKLGAVRFMSMLVRAEFVDGIGTF